MLSIRAEGLGQIVEQTMSFDNAAPSRQSETEVLLKAGSRGGLCKFLTAPAPQRSLRTPSSTCSRSPWLPELPGKCRTAAAQGAKSRLPKCSRGAITTSGSSKLKASKVLIPDSVCIS